MSLKADKHILRPGTSSIFVGGSLGHAPATWRLEVREEKRGLRQFFGQRRRLSAERGRPKLFHYISAGGMRQLRRTSADDLAEDRRHSFLLFLGLVAVLWTVFYFLPSA